MVLMMRGLIEKEEKTRKTASFRIGLSVSPSLKKSSREHKEDHKHPQELGHNLSIFSERCTVSKTFCFQVYQAKFTLHFNSYIMVYPSSSSSKPENVLNPNTTRKSLPVPHRLTVFFGLPLQIISGNGTTVL
jgi:hypothetical protein